MDYEIVKLKEIADFNKESIGKNSNYDFINYLDTANITNGAIDTIVRMSIEEAPSRAKRIVYNDDIVYSTVRPNLCHYGIIDSPVENMIVSTGFTVISCKDGVNPYYVYNYLTQNDITSQLHSIAENSTSAYPSIKPSDLENIEVRLPKLEIQNRIAKILTDIDKKIKLNNEINNNLRELCKTNYLRLIENNSTELSLSELMDYQGGSQPPASEFQKEKSEDNIRFVQIRDFETDSYVCYIPNSNKNKLCNKDDILIARYGASLGRICYGLSGAYNVALAKVLPKKEEYKELLRVILESDDFYNYINQVGQRSAQAGFNAGDIAGYNVIIPDENGLKEFNSISKNVIEKRLLIIDENRKLSELRDTLLPKLMNGEIDLDNIEI